MNQYTILISENEDFWNTNKIIYNQNPSRLPAGHTTTKGIFRTLQFQRKKVYLLFLYLNLNASEKSCSKADWNVWDPSLTLKDYVVVTASPLLASEVIFHLMDKMPLPGSYFLDICWDCANIQQESYKLYAPLLGVFKKLKLWHHAEINLLTTHKDSLSASAELIARFLSAGKRQILGSDVLLPFWNESCIWKGSFCIDATCSIKPKHSLNFQLLRHNCQPVFYDCFGNNEYVSDTDSHVWLGNAIKALELVDVTTIPLMLLSGNTFLLQCNKGNQVGKELENSLRSHKNAGMLCRLANIHTAEPFPPCPEISSDKWKEAVLKAPAELHSSNVKLCHQPQNIHFVLTTIPEETCSTTKRNTESLVFHAHALQIYDQLDATLYFEQELNSTSKLSTCPQRSKQAFSFSFPNVSVLQSEDQDFGNFFQFVLKTWINEKSEKLTPAILQSLILDSTKVFKKKFMKRLIRSSPMAKPLHKYQAKHNNRSSIALPELKCLEKAEQNGLPQTYDRKVDLSLHYNSSIQTKSTGPTFIEDILNRFEKLTSENALQSLLSLKTNKINIPPGNHLTHFASAITTSYHGINFNVDAQSSEKRDRHCRRLVEKLVKFETFSVGSKTQVPSPLTADIIKCSPTKPNRTPGKKKKLAKVAEKLYKKRNSLCSAVRPPDNATFKTPTKQRDHLDKTVMSSPSTHGMSLRSSTPTKGFLKAAVTSKRNLLSQSQSSKPKSRKCSQKLYVRDNKKKLQEMVVAVLAENNVKKNHAKFSHCVKRLYRVSMAFLKDLRTSKDLDKKIKQIVKENVGTVLSFEINAV